MTHADLPKLWESKPGLDPAVEAYTVGQDPQLDVRLLPYEVYASIAHAAGLARAGMLTVAEFRALRDELKNLLMTPGDFTVLREQEDIHTAVEQWLTKALGPAGAKIHTGRSRNDQVQADLRLHLKDRLLDLHGYACEASAAWVKFGKRWDGVLLPGYTHLQRAMPSSVSHWAASHAEAMLDACRSLRHAYEETDCSPLGSAAGYGVPLPLDRAYIAELLGFARVQRNTLRVQTSRPRIEAVALAALAVMARDIGVLADDLVLYSTTEFGFMKLDKAFTTGSSIMPKKRNPDVVELTRARAMLFPGWMQQVLAVGALTSGYHRDYQLTKGPVFEALDTATLMLDMARRLPEGLEVDAERCRQAVSPDMLATQQALALAKDGTPFRQAYRQVAAKGASAGDVVELPSYLGAPGNPGWDEILAEKEALWAWGNAESRKLSRAFKKLLSLEV